MTSRLSICLLLLGLFVVLSGCTPPLDDPPEPVVSSMAAIPDTVYVSCGYRGLLIVGDDSGDLTLPVFYDQFGDEIDVSPSYYHYSQVSSSQFYIGVGTSVIVNPKTGDVVQIPVSEPEVVAVRGNTIYYQTRSGNVSVMDLVSNESQAIAFGDYDPSMMLITGNGHVFLDDQLYNLDGSAPVTPTSEYRTDFAFYGPDETLYVHDSGNVGNAYVLQSIELDGTTSVVTTIEDSDHDYAGFASLRIDDSDSMYMGESSLYNHSDGYGFVRVSFSGNTPTAAHTDGVSGQYTVINLGYEWQHGAGIDGYRVRRAGSGDAYVKVFDSLPGPDGFLKVRRFEGWKVLWGTFQPFFL